MKVALFLIALTLLAACGKKGSPVPPGPANEIVFPKQYPSR
jgi:predicted small lipoprotein YifL